eukprot:NODE_43_length_28809_cov_0.237200.p18 type:complete len:140 gc:universal NODE_43_length_28809_cov_0.237200:21414-20995(-)
MNVGNDLFFFLLSISSSFCVVSDICSNGSSTSSEPDDISDIPNSSSMSLGSSMFCSSNSTSSLSSSSSLSWLLIVLFDFLFFRYSYMYNSSRDTDSLLLSDNSFAKLPSDFFCFLFVNESKNRIGPDFENSAVLSSFML